MSRIKPSEIAQAKGFAVLDAEIAEMQKHDAARRPWTVAELAEWDEDPAAERGVDDGTVQQ